MSVQQSRGKEPLHMTTGYKVQLQVNGEAEDPTAVTYQSIAKAEQVAAGYVTNAIKGGWEITSRTTDAVVIEDDDGDQVRIVVTSERANA